MCASAGIFREVTGINSALGPITAACPGDGRAETGGRLFPPIGRASPHAGGRCGEETDGERLSEEVRGILIKKDWARRGDKAKGKREAKQI